MYGIIIIAIIGYLLSVLFNSWDNLFHSLFLILAIKVLILLWTLLKELFRGQYIDSVHDNYYL